MSFSGAENKRTQRTYITLGPAYNEYPAKTSRFLCIRIIECNVRKFGYNEHPLKTSSFFCIFLLVVSGTQCTYISKNETLRPCNVIPYNTNKNKTKMSLVVLTPGGRHQQAGRISHFLNFEFVGDFFSEVNKMPGILYCQSGFLETLDLPLIVQVTFSYLKLTNMYGNVFVLFKLLLLHAC